MNFSGVCDPALDARMQAVADRGDPAGWEAIDREVTDLAAYAVLVNPRYIDFVSRRVDGFLLPRAVSLAAGADAPAIARVTIGQALSYLAVMSETRHDQSRCRMRPE